MGVFLQKNLTFLTVVHLSPFERLFSEKYIIKAGLIDEIYVSSSNINHVTPKYVILDPRKGRSYKITVVCLSVCMYVCHENQLCQFFQDWLLRFFLNLAQFKGTSIPIEW